MDNEWVIDFKGIFRFVVIVVVVYVLIVKWSLGLGILNFILVWVIVLFGFLIGLFEIKELVYLVYLVMCFKIMFMLNFWLMVLVVINCMFDFFFCLNWIWIINYNI